MWGPADPITYILSLNIKQYLILICHPTGHYDEVMINRSRYNVRRSLYKLHVMYKLHVTNQTLLFYLNIEASSFHDCFLCGGCDVIQAIFSAWLVRSSCK